MATLLTFGILFAIFYPRESAHTLFINDSCPHCEQTLKHMDNLKFHERVKVDVINIDYSDKNEQSFEKALTTCDLSEDQVAVPLLYFSDNCFRGTTQILEKLEELSISS